MKIHLVERHLVAPDVEKAKQAIAQVDATGNEYLTNLKQLARVE